MSKLKLLDLFSGIGGFSLGLERTGGFETVAFCEYDEKAQKVLKKHWPDVPIYEDVRTLDYDGTIDVISGGFPCQPFSVAGKQKGKDDDRHLWPAMFKLIQKHKPTWVIGENVTGLIALGLDSVLADLESENYRTRTFVIPACSVNAKHRRDRLWIIGERVVGNTNSKRCQKVNISKKSNKPKQFNRRFNERSILAYTDMQRCQCTKKTRNNGKDRSKSDDKQFRGCCTACGHNEKSIVADTSCKRQQGQGKLEQSINSEAASHRQTINAFPSGESCQWSVEPSVGRVANGIPRRMDRLKQLGNAVVPQIVEVIGNAILEAEKLES